MPAYDAALFTPPAPLARVTLRNRATGAALVDVAMLIDSGADVTLIPKAAIEPLGVVETPGTGYEVVGFDGSVSVARVVHVELVFCRRTFRGQFLLVDQPCGILGRNILNAVPLLLDGPNATWGEYHAAPRGPAR